MSTALAAELSGAGERLPVFALLALATTGFTAIMTETLPAGLLPQIAGGLHVTQAFAGQLVTAYAAGSLLAALPLTAWTQGLRRRPTLLAAISGFLVFNTLTALSQSIWLVLAARVLAGVAAGLAWGVLSGYARRLVAPQQQGRALAVAMLGTPLALSLGVPAGAFLGAAVGWRAAFLAMSVTSVALIGWVRWGVCDFAGQAADDRLGAVAVFTAPGIRPILVTVFAWMTAHNLLYTYIAPLAARAGMAARVDVLLLGFGVAAVVGIGVTGLLVDRALRRLVLGGLALFGAVAVALALAGDRTEVVYAGVFAWGLSFGGAATLLQTAAADAAGAGVDLASAMVTTAWNAAIAGGAVLGGLLLEGAGPAPLAWAAAALTLGAGVVALRARRYGFRPGRRTHPGGLGVRMQGR